MESREPGRRGGARHAARPPAPPHERSTAQRLLAATGDRSLQTLADVAARMLRATAAEVSLITDESTTAAAGGPTALSPGDRTPLSEAVCTLVAAGHAPLVVDDARTDDRVAGLGCVVRGDVGAYLGVPLVADDGRVVGALCVYERTARTWTEADRTLLQQLAVATAAQLEVATLDSDFAHADRQVLLAGAAHAAGIGSFSWHVEADVLVWDDPLLTAFGYDDTTFPGTIAAFTSRVHPHDLGPVDAALRTAIDDRGEYAADFRVVRPDGGVRWFTARGRAHENSTGTVRVIGAVTDVTALHEQEARRADVLEAMAVGYLALDADWRITYVNTEGERISGRARADLLGRSFWEAFPAVVGTAYEESYRHAVRERTDVVFDAHYPEPLDVWLEVRASPEGDGLALYVVDTTERHRAYAARDLASRRLHRTSEFAFALGASETIDDLVRTVAEEGLAEFGCNAGAVAVLDPDDPGTLRSHVNSGHGDRAQVEYGRLALSADLPVALAARTGRTVLVPDRAACLAFSPAMAQVLEATRSQAFVSLPLHIGSRTIGVVSAAWADAQTFDAERVAVLEAFAAQCAQALGRLQALEAERAAAARVAGLSRALQRSLLTELPAVDGLELVARYVPAADEAQVGGDWYDAFTVRGGTTCVVVGDVTGHDQGATVQMAQVRNVLRGTAHAVGRPPAAILDALDRALADLAPGLLATTVLAEVERAGAGGRALTWSNAGHPPPLLLHPDGRAELLTRPSDLMLGLGPGLESDRCDHRVPLPRGSTVLLVTDGLVERRGEDIDDGLARFAATAADLAHLPLPDLCDGLLLRLAADSEDDVALLALRVHA